MKRNLIIAIGLGLIILLGTSYAWFNYQGETGNQKVLAGTIYLKLDEGNDTINLTNVYPMTKEEARSRNDNYTTFTVTGKNTSDETVFYEIFLSQGAAVTGMTKRYNDRDLVFDLIEIDENEVETYLLDAVSFNSLNDTKIWVDRVLGHTNNEIERNYKLRVWLSDQVLISDTDPNRTYYATGENAFKNYFGSVKVGIYGDLNEKSMPSSATTRDSYVENGKSYFLTSLSNDYLLEEEGELLDENDTIILEITNPDNLLYFSYIDSLGNENNNQNESLRLTYVYNKNETFNIKVFTESRNDSNVKTTIHFKVTKNGSVVQEYNKDINVIGNNYCLNNGFTNLNDCVLVSENLSKNVATAKSYINSKGSPNINETAPTYTYVETMTENQEYTGTDTHNWSSGEKYVFNSATGYFTLKRSDGTTNASTYVALSNDLIGKYTCGYSGYGYASCKTIYKVTSVDLENNKITGTKITYNNVGSFDSQVGLYKVQDMDGDSYIFRGDVRNNHVLFGGYYWKIVRINGDGTIRLILNGNTLASNGNITAGNITTISNTNGNGLGTSPYPFNPSMGGPTYNGYMIAESNSYWMTSSTIIYSDINANVAYYFADDFEPYTDESGNKMFRLKGNSFKKKLSEITDGELEAGLYTCSFSESLVCRKLVKTQSRYSANAVNAYYITYSLDYETDPTLTKAAVESNAQNSNAKRQIDLWYQNKFMTKENNSKSVTTYLADAPFCNDRSSSDSGYLLSADTVYAGKTRLTVANNKTSTLSCVKNDAFTVTETSRGNGKLTYPIGMLTADEVALAGGKYGIMNANYYLRNNNQYFTMTPYNYYYRALFSSFLTIMADGSIDNVVGTNRNSYLRPVINLKANTVISGGDGSVSHPYIID